MTTKATHAHNRPSGPIYRWLHSLVMTLSLGWLVACTVVPEPLTAKDINATIRADLGNLFHQQEPVDHPIDLYEAMARSLKYNLDYRVNLLEKTIAQSEVDFSHYDLLPKLAANAGFTTRDPVEPSTDRKKTTVDLNVAWNVLDFGVSYFQAKQTADRLLVAEENRRKLVHNQIREVQTTFWQAAGAQNLQARIHPILQEARQALKVALVVEKERLRPQLEIMRFQRELLDTVRQLENLQDELTLAKKNLAKLLNLDLNTPFELVVPDENQLEIIPVRISLGEMEQLALQNRPELRTEMYNLRVSALETRKSLLRMLPGLDFSTAQHYDDNTFATYQMWQTAGLQVTSNLMKLVSLPATVQLAKKQAALGILRRMALNMAILSQIHIAYRKYLDSTRKFNKAQDIFRIDQRILTSTALSASQDSQTTLDLIRADTHSIMSQLQRNQAFAEAQNALGMIFVSLGVDLLPSADGSANIATLSRALQEAMQSWNEGIAMPPPGQPATPDGSSSQPDFVIESPMAKVPLTQPSVTTETTPTVAENLTKPQLPKLSPVSPALTTGGIKPSPTPPKIAKPIPTEAQQPAQDDKIHKKAPITSVYPPPHTEVPAKTPPTDPTTQGQVREQVTRRVKEWVEAWLRYDLQAFLNCYSPDFRPAGNWTQQQWQASYALIFEGPPVNVTLGQLAVEWVDDHRAKAYVLINFAANATKWEKRKTLVLDKEGNDWRIVEERGDTSTINPSFVW